MNKEFIKYFWHDCREVWDTLDESWDESGYVIVPYKKEQQSTMLSSGEYVILANSQPYLNVKKPLRVEETINISGIGTILKKEFRYSINGESFSEFQELNDNSLSSLGSFSKVWFQFRYILLSGGPVTVSRIILIYEKLEVDPYEGYIAPNIQNDERVYAFPITYKSNFLWEPYKMNRAVRLYKDLNLMANSLFGHDVSYYRVLPYGRSKDVFLMEHSLFEHSSSTCVKIIVPDNIFPDNKLSMGPFGVDFEMPFEVQIDKEYFQNIFGDGSGPQKRDVIHFHRTNRIYEVSTSYLFRDFMNEPLYFKITLIKWLPKTNVEQNESVNELESYTLSAGKLFGEEIVKEETKLTNPQQFNIAYKDDDLVRYKVYEKQEIIEEDLINYYTTVSQHYYKLDSALNEKKIIVNIDSDFLVKNKKYYARYSPASSQTDIQFYYSMKKFTYLGKNEDGLSIFLYENGESQLEKLFLTSQIFSPTSEFFLYESEYGENSNNEYIASCNVQYAKFYKSKSIQYDTEAKFSSNEDRSFSAWFKLFDNTSGKFIVDNFSFDIYTKQITINLASPFLAFIGDIVSLYKSSGGNFAIFGEVTEIISSSSIKIKIDQEIIDYVQANFSTWLQYTDIIAKRNFPRIFINSLEKTKGLKVELFENRHFKITLNDTYTYFTIPSNVLAIDNDKWYAIFINFSNAYKQLTLNLWKLQWDSISKLPATTDLKLVFNKTIPMKAEDRTSSIYFIEPSYMNLTNIRLFNRIVETDKQVFILNQNVIKDAHLAIIIDNAIPQTKMPYIGYTR